MKSKPGSVFNIFTLFALVASLLGGALTATPVHAVSPCFVDGGASGANDGTSWTDAYTDLPSALIPSCSEVWVAAGVYAPGASASDSFTILSGQAVYGGFNGTESLVTDRNPAANITILSGDFGADDANADGNRIDETTADIVGINSYHVVYMNGASTAITSSTVLDGFTITGGNNPGGYGGGMNCYANGLGNCSPTLSALTFSGNLALYGGAIMNEGPGAVSSPTLTDVTFRGNRSTFWGGALYNWGGVSGLSSPTLTNVTFFGNTATWSGGAMVNDGSTSGTSSPTLTNVTFNGNTADSGGAMSNYESVSGTADPILSNVILWGDTATGGGNEIYNYGAATPTIDYSVVQGGNSGSNTGTAWSSGTGNLSTDPKLDPSGPANNGGSTRTIALLYGSSAIDVGTTCSAFDQRGLARPVNSVCDIGAYEAPTFATGAVCYVDATDSGTPGSGASWSDPYIHLQAALANSNCTEIWVADGIYRPGAHVTDTFNVLPGVDVYGGFAGGEVLRTDRLPATNVAVLSGDIDDNDTNKDVHGATPTAGDIVGTNAYHVAQMDGTSTDVGPSTVLDGFTLTAGQATGSGYNNFGGGLFCAGSSGGRCSPELFQLVIIGNAAGNGGGIFADGSGGDASPTVRDTTFEANKSVSGWGGGMYNSGYGGLSDPEMSNVTFSGNLSASLGGAMMNDGRAGGESSPSLINATFDGNYAGDSGGALYNYGATGASSPLLENVTFSDNHASAGCGGGGAIDNNGASPTLANVTFNGNSACLGGAMYNWAATGGDTSSPTLVNVTFSGNSGNTGGAIYNNNNGGGGGTVNPILRNVILWGDTDIAGKPEMGNANGTEAPSLDHSVVEGGCGSVGVATVCGAGNLSTDPNLDPGGLANNGGYTKSLALMGGSSAIDNGDDAVCAAGPVNGLDQRGVYRPQGAHCDIGAYEKELPAAEMIRVLPDPDSTVCPLPVLQVQVYVLANILSHIGFPDPVNTQLKVDGVDVSGLAMNLETLTYPVAQVIVRYTPAGDLALGLHDAMFTYPSPGGPRTRIWSFTVASIPCDVVPGGPIDALGPVDSSQPGADGAAGVGTAPAGGRQP